MESPDDVGTEAEILRRLSSLLEDVEGTRVTLIGDVMLDRYHHGYANNLNSTAPVPALRIIRSEESPGAAAHIARGLNSLGMDVDFFSCVGDDNEGDTILEMISGDGISTKGISVVPNRKTLTKIRFYGSRESPVSYTHLTLPTKRIV